jgi:hypothetical protein
MAGMHAHEAVFGVDDDLQEYGVGTVDINRYIIRPAKLDLRALVPYVAHATKYQLKNIASTVTSSWSFGKGLLFAMVVLGLFCSAWDANRARAEAYLFLILGSVAVSLFSLQNFQERYVYILLPFMLLWAAKGIDELTNWAKRTWTLARNQDWGRASAPMTVVRTLLVVALLLLAAISNVPPGCDDFQSTNTGCILTKKAGIWLREQSPENKIIMDAGTAIPYYARAEKMGLPYSSSATAIRYILRKRPDFVVLRGTMRQDRPYLEEWLKDGVLDSHLRLVYEAGETLDDKIKIYRGN